MRLRYGGGQQWRQSARAGYRTGEEHRRARLRRGVMLSMCSGGCFVAVGRQLASGIGTLLAGMQGKQRANALPQSAQRYARAVMPLAGAEEQAARPARMKSANKAGAGSVTRFIA